MKIKRIHKFDIKDKRSQDNALLETIFSNTHLMIAYMDTNFNFIRVNRAYAQRDGKKPESFIGLNHFDLYPDEHNKLMFQRVVETGETYYAYAKPIQYAIDPHSGEISYWDWSLRPIKDALGNVEGLILCVINVTERKKAEEELLKAHKELESAKRLSDIGTLAAIVAHELRNPLGVIRTAAYNLKRKTQNPILESHFANIEKKILEADQIITNLLFYSRIKMPQYERVSIYDLLEECAQEAKKKFQKWKVAFNKRYRGIKKSFIVADPLQIKEVFNNMLNNAFESLPEKKGKITVEASYNAAKDEMSISFKDSGVGIDEEDLKKISKSFFTRKSRGTGLGLSVCYQIVNLHNGRIDVESKKGIGTNFTITLPAKQHEKNHPYR